MTPPLPTRIAADTPRTIVAAIAASLATLFALPATAQPAAFPDKPVRIVVPFPPAGGNDIIARALAEGMTKELGHQVLVENKPGAGTVIGSEFVATRPPDGYNLLIASFAHAVNISLVAKLPYDTLKAFAPVTLIGRSPNIVIVPPDRPYTTMTELTAYARANPGKLNYGSFGNGTSGHLAPELYKLAAKVDMVHVPYKGTGAAITDLLGGRLDVMFATVSGGATHVRSGKLRGLAVTSATRSPAYPELPTIAESGVPGYEAQTWYGILAPAGTPAPIVARLHAAISAAADTAMFKQRSESDGLVVNIGDGAALDKLIREEEARWRRVVKDANIQPD